MESTGFRWGREKDSCWGQLVVVIDGDSSVGGEDLDIFLIAVDGGMHFA